MTGAFSCKLCASSQPLESLADALCAHCLVCTPCASTSLAAQVSSQLAPPFWPPPLAATPSARSHEYAKGDEVQYITRERTLVSARVVQIDRSMQPPQYGIVLATPAVAGGLGGGDNVRFTEFDRLLPLGDGTGHALIPRAPRLLSPCCSQPLGLAVLHTLSPSALQSWSDACTKLWLHMNNIIRCPAEGCGALIQREAQQQQQGARAAAGQHAQGAQAHKQLHRFRCTLCGSNFCDACSALPYHEGLTCEDHARPGCLYCGAKAAPAAGAGEEDPGASDTASTSALRSSLQRLGVDTSWCLEKSELAALGERFLGGRVCGAPGCRARLRGACTRRLACGHFCVGVRGEQLCPPCPSCPPPASSCAAAASSASTSSAASACQLCLEPLAPGPAVQLSCRSRHMCHLECGLRRLAAGYPGPEVSFGHLFCPVCREEDSSRGNLQVATGPVHTDHPALQGPDLSHALNLRAEVVALAKAQLREDGLLACEPDLQPGGRFDGRPADFAIQRYTFYECSVCGRPYYGGARACRPAGRDVDRSELVCGGCSAGVATGDAGAECSRHGRAFIEYKCRYCCSPAAWFCWGSTHMCSDCHSQPARRRPHQHTCDPATCPLPVRPHPGPGNEFCMGCGLCRRTARAGK